jgi:hypothetical protein
MHEPRSCQRQLRRCARRRRPAPQKWSMSGGRGCRSRPRPVLPSGCRRAVRSREWRNLPCGCFLRARNARRVWRQALVRLQSLPSVEPPRRSRRPTNRLRDDRAGWGTHLRHLSHPTRADPGRPPFGHLLVRNVPVQLLIPRAVAPGGSGAGVVAGGRRAPPASSTPEQRIHISPPPPNEIVLCSAQNRLPRMTCAVGRAGMLRRL